MTGQVFSGMRYLFPREGLSSKRTQNQDWNSRLISCSLNNLMLLSIYDDFLGDLLRLFAIFYIPLRLQIPLLEREDAIFVISTMELDRYTDQEIAQAILRRDTFITKAYLYRKCYPLFKAIYDKYYTDCENPIELINEIYVYILMPHRETHRSKLQDFGFRCTLTMWLKIVTENYCHQLFAKRIPSNENNDVADDRNDMGDDSFIANTRKLDMDDVQKILSMMPNQRYRKLIEYRYVDEKSNEETAQLLEMSMANYYNCHKRAKAQYCEVLRKEGLI